MVNILVEIIEKTVEEVWLNMIERKDIFADMHIHTISSLHGYSTLKECIDVAADKGLQYIAITDHYYNDGTVLNRKNEVNRIVYLEKRASSTQRNVKIIGGAEFNIAQDIPDWNKLKKLKWKLIGVHSWFLDREMTTLDELFHDFEEAAERFTSFAHIERELHKIDHCKHGSELTDEVKIFLEKMVLLAKRTDTVLELNESSLVTNEAGAYERARFWLSLAKDNGNIISLGTDSHYCEEIGEFGNAIDLLNKVCFPKERILNCNEEILLRYLDKR